MPYRYKKRKRPIRKFVHWVSRKRAETIVQDDLFLHEPIFHAAEQLHNIQRAPNSRLIFIGTAMRPLFEAVRGLNEIEQKGNRKDCRYFITPTSHKMSERPEKYIPGLAAELIKRRIITPGKTEYYLVDWEFDGVTFAVLTKAIKQAMPAAKIHIISSRNIGTQKTIAEGIKLAENLDRPTVKDSALDKTRLKAAERWIPRWRYLQFQLALQEWLATRMKK